MNKTTTDDTNGAHVTCFELCAVEVEVGAAGSLVQLPGDTPQALGGWSIADSQISSRNSQRGAPVKTLVIAFVRPMVDNAVGMAPPVKAPGVSSPPARPGGPKRLQGPTPPAPPIVVAGAGTQHAGAAAASVAKVVGSSTQIVNGPTVSPAPTPGELDCACPEPAPAILNPAAAAVPCGQCGKWIQQVPEQPSAAEQPITAN